MPNYSESLPELFGRVSKAEANDEKIALLRGHKNTQVLHTILQGAFHPDIVWELPEGSPPYKKDDSEYGLAPSILEREVRKLVYFTSRTGKLIQNKMKREEIFVNMLESIHPSESELLIQMKDKRLDGLTARLVWEFMPGLIPEPAPEPEPVAVVDVDVKKTKPKKKRTKKNTDG
jgi:hypothetical protein